MNFRDENNLGLLRVDAHHASKVQASTHHRYRQRAGEFCSWLLQNKYFPETAIQIDDMIMEWKVDTNPSKANFENLLAAVEFVLPRAKGKLLVSRACAAGWARAHQARHTVPCSRQLAHLVACHLCAAGRHRLAIGLLLQQELGLRPNEMLNLEAGDIALPEDQPGTRGSARAVLGLGLRTGTKAKRPQAAVLRDGQLIGLLRWLKHRVADDHQVIPENYDQYRRAIKSMEEKIGLPMGLTPHSARAGYASDRMAEGWSFVEIREGGRWVADSSLRTYLDIVASASIALSLKTSGFNDAIAFSIKYLMNYFPFARSFQRDSDFSGDAPPRAAESTIARRVVRFGSSLHPTSALRHGAKGLEEGRRRVLSQGGGGADGSDATESSEASQDGTSSTEAAARRLGTGGQQGSCPGRSRRGRGRSGQGSGSAHAHSDAADESRGQGRGRSRRGRGA